MGRGRHSKFDDPVYKGFLVERAWVEKIEEEIGKRTGKTFSEIVRNALKPIVKVADKIELQQYNINIKQNAPMFQIMMDMSKTSLNLLLTELEKLTKKAKTLLERGEKAKKLCYDKRGVAAGNEIQRLIRDTHDLLEQVEDLKDLVEKMPNPEEETSKILRKLRRGNSA